MDELLNLIRQYDPYYEMATTVPHGDVAAASTSESERWSQRLRAEGHGPEIDALLDEYPHLISSPYGTHALA